MAGTRRVSSTESLKAKAQKLRKSLRNYFNLKKDPIPYDKNRGYIPRFTLLDKRAAADQRAKEKGERLTESFDEGKHHFAASVKWPNVPGTEFGKVVEEYPYSSEPADSDDPAAQWLLEREKNDSI